MSFKTISNFRLLAMEFILDDNLSLLQSLHLRKIKVGRKGCRTLYPDVELLN